MGESAAAKKSFYASEIEQLQPFSSDELLELLGYEFTDMTDSLKDYFSAQSEAGIVDTRRFRYELFTSIPSLSYKLSVVCNSMNAAFLNSRDFEIIDYTCSQGMSAVIMIERLKHKGFDISRIKGVTVIDPIEQRLENATCHLKAFLPEVVVRTVCKTYYEVSPSDLKLSSMYCIHLFGDIVERYQYMPLSFAALLKSTRLLFDCFIFFKDVQIKKDDRRLYSSDNEHRLSINNLFYWSSQLVDLIEPERVAGELKKDDNGLDWAFLIYGNHSLSNLFLPDSEDGVQAMVVDDYITSHITHQGVLYYRDDLLPQTKPFDRKDHMRAFHEHNLTIIEENFLIYKIADLYSSNPDAFCKIVARYKELADRGCYEAYNNLGVIKIMSEYEAEEDGSYEYILDEANELFIKAAEHGSTNAMVNLLSYYCAKENHERANFYIDKLIENNADRGYWEKATSLFLGVHEPQNIEQAKKYYELLLECIPGNEWPRGGYRNPAIFNLAKLELEHSSIDVLIRVLYNLETCSRPSVQQKILKAVVLVRLGLKAQAFELLQSIDEDESVGGNEFVLYYNLATCYMYGIGCKKDYKKAETYFKKTLEKNSKQEPFYPRGYRGIGNLYYEMGRYEEAKEHYAVALEYDKDFYCATRTNLATLKKEDKCLIANELLDSNNGCLTCHEANNYDVKKRLCPKCQVWLLSGKTINEDNVNTKAIVYLKDPARQGYPKAQSLMGQLLIDDDAIAAKEWLTLAAMQGEAEAQSKLYLIDKDHSDSKCPSNQALRWLALSAKSLADSQLLLYYEYQINKLPGDAKDIFKWLVQAATNGSSMAEFILGSQIYDNGQQEYGIQLLVRAANKGQTDAIDWLEEKKLESLELRKQIAKILYANSQLTKVTKEEQYQHGPEKESGLVYSSDHKRLLFYFGLYGDEAHIDEGTICICDDCFNDRYSEVDYFYLETVYLPKTLKHIGQNAFNTCLTNIYSESENFIIEDSALFSKDKKVLIRYFGNDEVYTVPNGVEKIEGGALWARELKKVHLPASLSIVNGNPFLTDDPNCFPIVTSHSSIITAVNGLITDVVDKKIIAYIGKERELIIPDGIIELGRDCLLGSEIESIYLPTSLSKVDESSFYQCFNLKEIHIPPGCKQRFVEFLPKYATGQNSMMIFEDYSDGEGEQGSIIEERNTVLKEDASQIERYLEDNGVRCFYHFTDRKNLESIRKNGGLYSWSYCEKNGISIPVPGGSSSSRSLDRRYHLEDYVRLSFCEDHPMAFRLQEEGADLVLLKINTDVATLKDTLFSDINATDNNHHHGGKLDDLKRVDIQATKQTYVSKESPFFKKHQAEVLVKTHIPLDSIINLDNPLPL